MGELKRSGNGGLRKKERGAWKEVKVREGEREGHWSPLLGNLNAFVSMVIN